MHVLITGAFGFIGKNLTTVLDAIKHHTYEVFTKEDDEKALKDKLLQVDAVIHLAGVNRPQNQEEFLEGNRDLTQQIVNILTESKHFIPILFTSSIQAELDNPYGHSKKLAEDVLLEYASQHNVPVTIYRLPNVFGKWCKPNYNSVVATFCYNIANDLPITIHDESKELNLVYIDDIIDAIAQRLEEGFDQGQFYSNVEPIYKRTLGDIANLITAFKGQRRTFYLQDLSDSFVKKLHATFTSYLPLDGLSYKLVSHQDQKGSFTEVFKTHAQGQISINVSKPGITKGNHWHQTKNEKFLVVQGEGIIRFRRVGEEEVVEYKVSGSDFEVIDIPVGCTHNIENIGQTDLITIMWANETFDPNNLDTYFELV